MQAEDTQGDFKLKNPPSLAHLFTEAVKNSLAWARWNLVLLSIVTPDRTGYDNSKVAPDSSLVASS